MTHYEDWYTEWFDEDMDELWDADDRDRLRDGASRALGALKKRKGEDVDEWARRIADDVCEATD